MAAKKTTKKTGAKKNPAKGGATATLEKPDKDQKEQVEELPKGQSRAKDGTIILTNGEHKNLAKGTYEVHGTRLELEGSYFVAQYDVNWLPVKQCGGCKEDRPDAIEIRKLGDGKWAAFGKCANKKCQYNGLTYLWIMPQDRFRV